MNIVELTRTCTACPAQWEGRLDDGRYVYMRYRWGTFGLSVGLTMEGAVRNPYSFIHETGDAFDGYMTEYELRAVLRHHGVVLKIGLVPDPCDVDHNGSEMRGNCLTCGASPGPDAQKRIQEEHEQLMSSLKKMREDREAGTDEAAR